MLVYSNYKECNWFKLDTSIVPSLIYAVMGTSREGAIGSIAIISLLLLSMIQKVVDPTIDQIARIRLVFTTFFIGIFQAAFRFFRCVFYFLEGYFGCQTDQ